MPRRTEGSLPAGFRPSIEGLPLRSIAPSPKTRVITSILLVFVAAYFLVPIFWLIVASGKNNTDLTSSFGFWFAELNWSTNWTSLRSWTNELYPRWVLNSILYSTISAAAGTLLRVAAGYAMARFVFPGRKAILVTVLAGLLLPVVLLTVPLYLVFNNIGLTYTIWSILIPRSVSPFGVFLG